MTEALFGGGEISLDVEGGGEEEDWLIVIKRELVYELPSSEAIDVGRKVQRASQRLVAHSLSKLVTRLAA
eukprot:511516-Hanusia_phi.AAC.1